MTAHEEEALGRAYDARLMRRLVGYLRPYGGRVALAVAAIVGHSVLQLVPPLLTRIVIDDYIPAGDLSGLAGVAALYLGTIVASFGLEFAQTWQMQSTGQLVMFDLRMEIHDHLQRLDLRFHDRNPVGRLMTRLTTDVDVINELFTSGSVAVFGDLFTLVGILGVLLWMDWRLAALVVATVPLIVVVAQWFRVHVRESYRTVRARIARINAFLQERITGMATVHLFGREGRDYQAFDDINRQHRDANVQSLFYYAVFFPAIELVSALSASLIIWFGSGWVLDDALTLGSLVAFLQYSQRFFRPIADMSEKFNTLQGAMASSERIFGLLDTPVHILSPTAPSSAGPSSAAPSSAAPSSAALSPAALSPAALSPAALSPAAPLSAVPPSAVPPSAVPAPRAAGAAAIAFEGVTFGYLEHEPVLHDISFRIEPGQRIGLVGATGSGKTTIVNLLLRFYDVQAGRITIGGVDVREMSLPELRRQFALVLQDVHLFSGTIAGNIRLGETGIDDAAVRRAAEAVHAAAFIDRLPGGMAAPVAERGATLSVGQKQLLSLARALAFDRPVLVLDEATSSIDTDTELLIRDALRTVMRGRTT
ncbi:MAG: ABC transporter ATP-binding protein, partial [Acidobacteria bacterium]|nr:ABC transporter ATP-binding protein [Acidobacteriota bacterium]